MTIPVAHYGKAYPKSSQGTNVFTKGGKKARSRKSVPGNRYKESGHASAH